MSRRSAANAPPTRCDEAKPNEPRASESGWAAGASTNACAFCVYLGVVGFSLLMTVAILLYPGGNLWDHSQSGYDFWNNFWCDLLRQRAYNGVPNRFSPRLAQGAMLVLALAMGAYFSAVTCLLEPRGGLRRLVPVLGVCGAVGLAVVSLLSGGSHPALHGVTVLVAGPTGTSAVVATLVGLVTSRGTSRLSVWLGALMLGASLFALAQFAREFVFSAPSSKWLPFSQKLATLLALGWMWVVSAQARRVAGASSGTLGERRS